MRNVLIVAYDRVQLLDIAGPLQTFATANDISGAQYRLIVASPQGGEVASSAGLPLVTRRLQSLARLSIDTLIVAGGHGVHAAAGDRGLIEWLRHHAPRARRVCSVCTGAFLLAEAGLLAGRRAVTHWKSCALLQERYPELRVESDPIYLRDGPVWTSAGVTAGIDLALALIEDDLGRGAAMQVARHLVMFLKRPGGQSQFSVALAAQASSADRGFAALHAWMAEHLGEDLRVERLAERAGMSPRNFARRYTAQIGTTPARAVEAMRIEAACRRLEESDMPAKRIAGDCGFGDEERMRRAFLRRLGVNPLDYRRRFAGSAETRNSLQRQSGFLPSAGAHV
jgi:transcriptional regulator GlxA family with amidase domain